MDSYTLNYNHKAQAWEVIRWRRYITRFGSYHAAVEKSVFYSNDQASNYMRSQIIGGLKQ